MNAILDMLSWILLGIALAGIALMLRALGRRLGEALHMKKYYYLYDASLAIFAISIAAMLLSYPEGAWALPARLLFLSGAVLMGGVTIRYWGWIVPEILMPGK